MALDVEKIPGLTEAQKKAIAEAQQKDAEASKFSAAAISNMNLLRKEPSDMHYAQSMVAALNSLCEAKGSPLVFAVSAPKNHK